MTTRREYAVSLGLAKFGRGRMSVEANAACDAAEAKGMVFTEPVAVPAPKSKSKAEIAPQVLQRTATVRAKEEYDRKAHQVAENVPEGPSKAFTGKFEVQIPDGKRKALSERTACTCGASLCYCRCSKPSVYRTIVDPGTDNIDEVLTIERV